MLSAVFQSVDHANKSLMITLLRQMVLLLPIVYLLANQFGLNALWWAFPITEAAVSILAYIYLKIVKAKTIMKISQKA